MAELPYGVTSVREGEWTTGIYDCGLDWGLCCLTLLCPCWTYGENSQNLGGRRIPDCLACCFMIPVCAFLTTSNSRYRLRKKYDLPDEPFGDLATACLCTCCALAQEAREIKCREEAKLAARFDTIRAPPEQLMEERH